MWLLKLAAGISAMLLPVLAGEKSQESDKYTETFKVVNIANATCSNIVRYFDPLIHKPKYRVGVFSNEGDSVVFEKYNLTFNKYLTATAGRRFDPPIKFEVVPVTLTSLMNLAEAQDVDFSFSSSSVASCMATEQKAQQLVTIISRREARGHQYDLDVYGGVMFTLADNDEVKSIDDFKDKTIGAGGITMMGGGQTQFYEMVKQGLSYVADPLQVVFTHDEEKTVQGVLDGDFEIGFARTDQIERHKDANGETLDPDTFKIINTQTHIMDDGQMFPFLSSTGLNPEWPVAALHHVSSDVSREVQEALLALRDHATAIALGKNLRCDTTPEIARLAQSASISGLLTGFRTARSYFEVRTKQQVAGFLRYSKKGHLRCIRGETLYEDIECPADHYKLVEEDFHKSCELVGLKCKEGYECYCKPCIKAFEVDIYQLHEGDNTTTHEGCEKMSLCGHIEQTKDIILRLRDNVKRDNAEVKVLMRLDEHTMELDVHEVPGLPWTYETRWARGHVGVGIMEVFFNGVHIPQSPVRVQVTERNCAVDYPGTNTVASPDGSCICGDGTVEVGGKCVNTSIFAIVGSIGGVIIVGIVGLCYMRYRAYKNDEIWQVNVDELHFDDPPEVVGQGSFGVVLLAEYRGTKVAIKRALKMSKRKGGSSRTRSRSREQNHDADAREPMSLESSDHTRDDSIDDIEAQSIDRLANPAVLPHSYDGSKGVSVKTFSIGFLALNCTRDGKWAWLLPWRKKSNYHTRFKETILGESASLTNKSFIAILCPWLDKHAREQEDFVREMRVLSRLRHPCITTVMGAVIGRTHDPMLVMEYMEYGSLHDLLRNETMHLTGDIIMQISRDVAQGLRYLHASKPAILHGDLKGRNILIDSRFRAKICDFGLSMKQCGSITGTPFWLAPEYLRGEADYNEACDIYSMGVLFYEIYSRQNPYQGEDFREVLRKVCDRRVNKRPDLPARTPPKMADLMKQCWRPDAQFRPKAKDLDMALMSMNVLDAEPLVDEPRKEVTKDMLYELFPRRIADALKKGEKVEPESHELVTVVFSDVVRFTDISREISPLKVSSMLDRLYLSFDLVAKKHQVFKVETIGDAYMGVTNLEGNQSNDHVKNVALFAVDLIKEASKILIDEDEPSKGYISVRVGFHSGPVVSNVIGSLNPRYGLFGDTVNTASRMESNSGANKILCSQRSYKLLKEQAPEIRTKRRGKINVKGKGEMPVYWVGDSLETNVSDEPEVADIRKKLERRVGFAEDDDHLEAAPGLWEPPLTASAPQIIIKENIGSTAVPQEVGCAHTSEPSKYVSPTVLAHKHGESQHDPKLGKLGGLDENVLVANTAPPEFVSPS